MGEGWRVLALCVGGAALAACNREPPAPGIPQPVATSASASAPATAVPSAASPAPVAPREGATETWKGTYHGRRGAPFIPDGGDWESVRWRGDDAGDGLGDGSLSLVVERPSGLVTGSLSGPLGPAIVRGTVDGILLTATFTPDATNANGAPQADGFRGTLTVAMPPAPSAEAVGSLRASSPWANLVREGALTLRREP